MNAIPTMYKGRLYRSQLEARWACFFELVGWKYEYEPYPLNGWIPDFVLLGTFGEILVEVKPYTSLEEFDTHKFIAAMRGTEKEEREILLLGLTIFKEPYPSIGWIGESYGDESKGGEGYWFQCAAFDTQGGLGFLPDSGQFTNRITGVYGGGHWIEPEYDEVLNSWNKAGNIVRWNPRP